MSAVHEDYMCDCCGEPFTLDEWDARETPHDVDCINHPDHPDHVEGEYTNCRCDNNYHAECI
jgi:hypothetical protein